MKYFLTEVIRGAEQGAAALPGTGRGEQCLGKRQQTMGLCLGTCLRRGLSSWEEEFVASVATRCGEEEWCPCERGPSSPQELGVRTGMVMVTQACLCYITQAGQTFLEVQPSPCPSSWTMGFWSLYEFQAEAPAVQGFSCPDSVCLSLVMQGHKVMQVPAKCKFGFWLIMTSLS